MDSCAKPSGLASLILGFTRTAQAFSLPTTSLLTHLCIVELEFQQIGRKILAESEIDPYKTIVSKEEQIYFNSLTEQEKK